MDDQNKVDEKKGMPNADVKVDANPNTDAKAALEAQNARVKTEKEVTAQ